MKLADHPTVIAYNEKKAGLPPPPGVLETNWLKGLAMDAGADDVGVVELSRDFILPNRGDLLDVMPDTRTVMVVAFRVNQSHLRSLSQSVTDFEFKQVWTRAAHIGRDIVDSLGQNGIKAVNMPVGFPQEVTRWPGKIWLTNDKGFAVEAGLGHMGYNRLVLHPKFGAGVVFGSILVSGVCDSYDQPIDFNPCIECNLCVKVCPVGAVKSTDNFDMLACLTHNYRERLGGFQNWVEQVVESRDVADYRNRVSDRETVSMWQHLTIGAQNRCDRCMAVCPAGESAIGEFLDDRKRYTKNYLTRFRDLAETVYAVKGSDAELHVEANFPAKKVKNVSNGIRPDSAQGFLSTLPLAFQAGRSEGLDAVFHFTFTGKERLEGTVTIREKLLNVEEGRVGTPDLHVTADSRTWIKFLNKETHLLKALICRKIKINGPPRLMQAFARCFPS